MPTSGFEDIEEVRIDSLGQLLDRVTPEEHDPVSGRIRDTSVYRGSGHATWPLLTSLDRLGGIDPPHTKAHLEEHILRNFIRYSRSFLRSRRPTSGSCWWPRSTTACPRGSSTGAIRR